MRQFRVWTGDWRGRGKFHGQTLTMPRGLWPERVKARELSSVATLYDHPTRAAVALRFKDGRVAVVGCAGDDIASFSRLVSATAAAPAAAKAPAKTGGGWLLPTAAIAAPLLLGVFVTTDLRLPAMDQIRLPAIEWPDIRLPERPAPQGGGPAQPNQQSQADDRNDAAVPFDSESIETGSIGPAPSTRTPNRSTPAPSAPRGVAPPEIILQSCPSPYCGSLGRLIAQERMTVYEQRNGWIRISDYFDADCRGGTSPFIEGTENACTAENGVRGGKVAEWAPAAAFRIDSLPQR